MIVETKEKLKEVIDSAKAEGKSVLVKKGVFDIIHPGHTHAMKMFSEQADVVVILVQSDALTKKKKGELRPVNNQEHRALVVDGLKGVDYVFEDKCMSRDEYRAFLDYLKPTVVAVTAIDEEKTKAYTSAEWELKEFPDKKMPGFSTTEVIDRCRGKPQ